MSKELVAKWRKRSEDAASGDWDASQKDRAAVCADELESSLAGEADGFDTRSRDWICAMASALGMDSGYSVPIVPEPEPFRRLFAEIRRPARPAVARGLPRDAWALGHDAMNDFMLRFRIEEGRHGFYEAFAAAYQVLVRHWDATPPASPAVSEKATEKCGGDCLTAPCPACPMPAPSEREEAAEFCDALALRPWWVEKNAPQYLRLASRALRAPGGGVDGSVRCSCEWAALDDGTVRPDWPAMLDPKCQVHAALTAATKARSEG